MYDPRYHIISKTVECLHQGLDYLAEHVPFVLFMITLLGLLVGWLKYGISILQPLEKIAHDQQEYRRKSKQESLRDRIVERHVQLGYDLLLSGNYEAAKAEFRAALERDMMNERAEIGLFKAAIPEAIASSSQSVMAAKQKIDFLLELDPKDGHAHYFLGVLNMSIDYRKAIAELELALEAIPGYPAANFQLGIIHEEEESLDGTKAMDYYVKCIGYMPLSESIINNIAYQELRRGEFARAAEKYEMLLRMKQDELLPLLTIASAYAGMGNIERAVESVDRFIQIARAHPEYFALEKNNTNWIFASIGKRRCVLKNAEEKLLYGLVSSLAKHAYLGNRPSVVMRAKEITLHANAKGLDRMPIVELVQHESSIYLGKDGERLAHALSALNSITALSAE